MVTATTRLRLEKQAYASNDEAWGDHLNEGVFDRLDEAVAGYDEIALTGNYTLDVQNYILDEARNAVLKFTGTGSFTVTAPAVSKTYVIWNACTGDLTLKPSGGTGSVIRAGKKAVWFTDGSVGYTLDPTLDEIKTAAADVALGGQKLTGVGTATSTNDAATLANKIHEFAAPTAALSMNAQKITNLATPTATTDAASKSYVDGFAFNAALPGGSAAGQVAIFNGSVPVWGQVDLADSDARTGTLPVANGGTGIATLATGSVPIGAGTGAFTAAAPGAAGGVLTSNGAGVAPSFQVAAAGSMVLLSTQTVGSAVSSVDFTTNLNSTYDVYEFHLINVKPASDGVALWFRTSTNGGSSYDSGATDYAHAGNFISAGNGSSTSFVSTGTSIIALTSTNLGNGADDTGICGVLRVFRPSSAQFCQVLGHFTLMRVGGLGMSLYQAAGYRAANADVDAVRFFVSTGNIASGTIRHYGIKKT